MVPDLNLTLRPRHGVTAIAELRVVDPAKTDS